MKWIELKKMLDKFSNEQLQKDALFLNEENSTSGVLNKPIKCKADLIYTHEDDPCPLYTRSQLRDRGMDKEEIEECSVEIARGEYYFLIV